jgi:hypothetical protein
MRKQLRFRWTEGVTTTAGHVATSLIPTDTFTQDFINKAIGISAGVYGFDPSYLDRKEFVVKLFPEESQDLRHARIYCKEVVSFKEVCDERTNPRTC